MRHQSSRSRGTRHPGAAAVVRRYSAELMALDGVVSVGVAERDGTPVVVVGVTEEGASAEVPELLDGVPVVVAEIGRVEAQRDASHQPGSRTDRQE